MSRRGVSVPDYLATVAFFSGIATLALLLTTLCVPFDKSLYVFRLSASAFGQTRNVDFGVFGYCPWMLDMERNGEFPSGVVPRCLKPTLGWFIGSDLVKLLQAPDSLSNSLSRQVTSVLVIYPVAASLSFISFLVACTVFQRRRTFRKNHGIELPPNSGYFKAVRSFVQIALAGSTAALFINIIVISIMKTRVNSLRSVDESLQLKWGNLIVVNVIAWLFLLLATAYANKLQNSPRPVVITEGVEAGAQGRGMPPETIQTLPQAQFVAAPAYKASQADRLLEQGQNELPPTYDNIVQMPVASTSVSQVEPPSDTSSPSDPPPLVAESSSNRFSPVHINRKP